MYINVVWFTFSYPKLSLLSSAGTVREMTVLSLDYLKGGGW